MEKNYLFGRSSAVMLPATFERDTMTQTAPHIETFIEDEGDIVVEIAQYNSNEDEEENIARGYFVDLVELRENIEADIIEAGKIPDELVPNLPFSAGAYYIIGDLYSEEKSLERILSEAQDVKKNDEKSLRTKVLIAAFRIFEYHVDIVVTVQQPIESIQHDGTDKSNTQGQWHQVSLLDEEHENESEKEKEKEKGDLDLNRENGGKVGKIRRNDKEVKLMRLFKSILESYDIINFGKRL